MASVKFSKSEAIKYGFAKAKKNWKFFIPVVLVALLLNLGPRKPIYLSLQQLAPDLIAPVLAGFVLSTLFWVLGQIVNMGMINLSLKFADNKKFQLADLIYLKPLVSYLLGTLLYFLIILGGFVLLIIPGIIWAIKFQYYSYLIVDKNLGPIEALKHSWQITKGIKWQLFLFGILLMLLNIAGVLALGIGLFLTIPTTMLASAYVYRKLQS